MPISFFNRAILIGSVAAWLGLVGVGTSRFLSYENTAGSPTSPPVRWPAASRLALASELPTLTLFLHPQCPCSRASVAEFREVLLRNPGKVRANVVFLQPEGVSASWDRTDLYRSVSKLPGVRLFLDRGGRESVRFRVSTSGTVLLYNPKGRLLFHGGVTLSRGHLGDSPGRDSLLSLLDEGKADRTQTPVFGCPLSTPKNYGLDRIAR